MRQSPQKPNFFAYHAKPRAIRSRTRRSEAPTGPTVAQSATRSADMALVLGALEVDNFQMNLPYQQKRLLPLD